MKRIFINRVLAFLLIGATLTYAGCKDYDDDIDDINKKIDDLNAKVELKAAARMAVERFEPPMRPPKRLRQLRKPSPMPRRKPSGRLFLNASL